MVLLLSSLVFLAVGLLPAAAAQEDGYIGYNLEHRGDPESVVYETADTDPGVGIMPKEPDVYLNASLYVGEIDIEVDNITAKVNLDAQVLKLLHFTAGVDASIDRVKLTIQNVSAKVELEARLENVVAMVSDVLHSIDLNPIVATLGQDVGKILNTTIGVLSGNGSSGSGSGSAHKRSELDSQPRPQHPVQRQQLPRRHAHEPRAGAGRHHLRHLPRQRWQRDRAHRRRFLLAGYDLLMGTTGPSRLTAMTPNTSFSMSTARFRASM